MPEQNPAESMMAELDTVFARHNDLVVEQPETVVALLINTADSLRDKFSLDVEPMQLDGDDKYIVFVGGDDIAGFLGFERTDDGQIVVSDMPANMAPDPVQEMPTEAGEQDAD